MSSSLNNMSPDFLFLSIFTFKQNLFKTSQVVLSYCTSEDEAISPIFLYLIQNPQRITGLASQM